MKGQYKIDMFIEYITEKDDYREELKSIEIQQK